MSTINKLTIGDKIEKLYNSVVHKTTTSQRTKIISLALIMALNTGSYSGRSNNNSNLLSKLEPANSELYMQTIESEEKEKEIKELQGYQNTLQLYFPLDEGEMNSGFGMRKHPVYKKWRMHEGIDLVPRCTEKAYSMDIYAAKEGVVSYVGWKSGYGRIVEIEHNDSTVTRYAHLKKHVKINGEAIKSGMNVTPETIVGSVGNSGTGTGYHLHFELLINGLQVDPIPYFQEQNNPHKLYKITFHDLTQYHRQQELEAKYPAPKEEPNMFLKEYNELVESQN